MDLEKLLEVPAEQRDPNWEAQFFTALLGTKLRLVASEPQSGPDGWPYLLAQTGAEGTEPTGKLLHWLAPRGIGLVINPEKEYPDFVFNYGMVWHFQQTGLFYATAREVPTGTLEIAPGAGVLAGPPTDAFLPASVRSVLREFFPGSGFDGGKNFGDESGPSALRSAFFARVFRKSAYRRTCGDRRGHLLVPATSLRLGASQRKRSSRIPRAVNLKIQSGEIRDCAKKTELVSSPVSANLKPINAF